MPGHDPPGAASGATLAAPEPGDGPSHSPRYAAVFKGDPTGATDVTRALRSFFQRHDGQHVALAENATYLVTQVTFTAHDLTVDFRGAKIQGRRAGVHGILRIETSTDVVLNDPTVYGTGYEWVPAYQQEHGIHIDGGSHITLHHPTTRDTHGDGIYTSYQRGINRPPVRVLIIDPDIERASRNGIAPVAGDVTVRGGHISHVGLHGVDFEPSLTAGATSIRGVVDGIDIRHHGDLVTGHSTYAVAAGGHVLHVGQQPSKRSILIENVTGDCLRMTIRNTIVATVRNNISDVRTSANFQDSGLIAFNGNVRISGTLRDVVPCEYPPSGPGPRPTDGPKDVPGPDATLYAHDVLYWLYVTVPKALHIRVAR
jgi:hypothetical protein